MASTTPLLSLLDAMLSWNEEQIANVVREIEELILNAGGTPLKLGGSEPNSKISSAETTEWRTSLSASIARLSVHETEDGDVSNSVAIDTLCQVIQQLLSVFPELASRRSAHDGSLPLHFAASLGNLKVASIILDTYPEAACSPNHKGKIPLHYAAREGRTELVRYLLHRVPRSATICSEKKKLPVHFAAGDGHVEICRALLSVFPQAASMASAKGKFPLHFASRWGHLTIAQDLLDIYPKGVQEADHEGSLPLHDAAREGQCRMARFLIERYPQALSTCNLRGEIPLFPAVRSGNVDLIVLMVQVWPKGGQHVLQHVRDEDFVSNWDWETLELLLRGAAKAWDGCSLLQGREPPTVCLTEDLTVVSNWGAATCCSGCSEVYREGNALAAAQKPEKIHDGPLEHDAESFKNVIPTVSKMEGLSVSTAMTNPRSKSPILDSDDSTDSSGGTVVSKGNDATSASALRARKRSGSVGGLESAERKRSRQLDHDHSAHAAAFLSFRPRKFWALHAAFEAQASSVVLRRVWDHCQATSTTIDDVLGKTDDWERLPLHWAVQHHRCRQIHHHDDDTISVMVEDDDDREDREATIQFVLDHLVTPSAARHRDIHGRLPLHIAIQARADVRIVSALLDAYPIAGVEACQSHDDWCDKMPLDMATHFECDLGTTYQLLRVDPSYVQMRK